MIDFVGTVKHCWAPIGGPSMPLLFIAMAIMACGLVGSFRHLRRQPADPSQVGNMGVALAIVCSFPRQPPQKLMRLAVPLYVVGVILLVSVFLRDQGQWRQALAALVPRIQPSEIMKIAMP